MARSGEQGQSDVSVDALLALADGSLLRQMGEVTADAVKVLESASQTALAIKNASREQLLVVLRELVVAEETLPGLENLKATLIEQGMPIEDSPLSLHGYATLIAKGGIKGFADLKRAEFEILPIRERHGETAFKTAEAIMAEAEDRQTGFRPWPGYGVYPPHDHGEEAFLSDITNDQDDRSPGQEYRRVIQTPFVEVEPGLVLAVRHCHKENGPSAWLDPAYRLVVKVADLEEIYPPDADPREPKRDTYNMRHGKVYANMAGGRIWYNDETINSNVHLAEAADREVIEKLTLTGKSLHDLLLKQQEAGED